MLAESLRIWVHRSLGEPKPTSLPVLPLALWASGSLGLGLTDLPRSFGSKRSRVSGRPPVRPRTRRRGQPSRSHDPQRIDLSTDRLCKDRSFRRSAVHFDLQSAKDLSSMHLYQLQWFQRFDGRCLEKMGGVLSEPPTLDHLCHVPLNL